MISICLCVVNGNQEQIDSERGAMEGPRGNYLAIRMCPVLRLLPKLLLSENSWLQRRISRLNLS